MRGSKALKFVYILPVCFAVADSRHGTTGYAILAPHPGTSTIANAVNEM